MKNTMERERHDVLAFTLGDRLAKAMKVSDVSRGDLAEYLGVSPTTIGNYTADRTPVKKQTLRLWAMRTGVPLEWLENGVMPNAPDGNESRLGESNSRPSHYE